MGFWFLGRHGSSSFATCLGFLLYFSSYFFSAVPSIAAGLPGPEEVIRALVRANADKDFATMSRLMAHDEDAINYTIGGRTYRGWEPLAEDLRHEFASVQAIEIPIKELRVWSHGDVAWFAMELDYIRIIGRGAEISRAVLPLRETGVLERQADGWILKAWHESMRDIPLARVSERTDSTDTPSPGLLGGEWEIQEEDKSYKATLDANGNGTYTWQGGTITTTRFHDRLWEGTWRQPGNDREGGFEVLLSEDGRHAKGVWWYTRVGDRTNIPPRRWGGPYTWTRLTPADGDHPLSSRSD
jgi:ketosteroid isomerase-like protein